MRLFLLLLFISASVCGQDLITSRRSSYFTFVYKLAPSEARRLYEHQKPTIEYCHTLHSLYPTDSAKFQDELPVGHYLLVKTVSDKLHYELVSVNNTSVHILNNQRDLLFTVSNRSGIPVTDADVKIKGKKIAFSKEDNAYTIQKSNHHGIVSVTLDHHTSFFAIERRRNNTFFVRMGKKVLGTFPVNHLASMVIYPIRTVKNLALGNHISPPGIFYKAKRLVEPGYEKNWIGYMVFNKPMFKPGDTLKLKAFITTKKGRPVKKELEVWLYNYGRNAANLKLKTVSPYRAGAYVYEFVLTDSLKLSLDTNPGIQLEHRDKTALSKSFRYEQYELKANQFFARADTNDKEKGATLYLKGTDSNDMPLYDVRTEILIQPATVNQVYENRLFIADTLWFYTQKLDAIGETKIMVPENIFPNASLNYKAVIAFINADNERHTKELNLQYEYRQKPVRFEVKNDSVWILPKTLAGNVALTAFNKEGDEIFTKEVSLPHREKINPFVKEYEVGGTPDWETLEMSAYDNLEVLSSRTADSVTISVKNPRKILFHYQIFQHNRQLVRGSASQSTLIFKDRAAMRESFTVSVQYMWAGATQQENYAVTFNDRQLNVSILHEPLVYPGQTTDFTIHVTDAKGKPVNQADVTAFAITKKFKQATFNQLPSYPRKQKSRTFFNSFSAGEFEDLPVRKLDWVLWNKTLGLDSISFYQFLYPTGGRYLYEKPTADSITQLAPYAVEDGQVIMPNIIYINNTPVFHSSVNTIQPYSFRVGAGVHQIRMRIKNYAISFTIDIKKNNKQILAIDLKNLPADVVKLEYDTKEVLLEQQKISKYFITVHRSTDQARAYLWQYDNYFLFNTSGARGYPYAEVVGPLHPQLTKFVTVDSSETTFNYEPFFSYQFLPGLIRQRSLSKPVTNRNYGFDFSPAFNDRVITAKEIQKRWVVPESIRRPNFVAYTTHHITGNETSRLRFFIQPSATQQAYLAVFIINLDNPDQYSIYPAYNNTIPKLAAAHYELILLMNDLHYLRSGKFFLSPFGQTFITLQADSLQSRDSFSEKLYHTLKSWDDKNTYVEQLRRIEMNEVRTSYYTQRTDSYPYSGNMVRGRVVATDDGSPLPGVNVIVKGTSYGTVTDANGEYSLNAPPNSSLVFSFIGLHTKEVYAGSRNQVDVNLEADVTQLSEVVVVGFGVSREKRALSYSVATVQSQLMGRMAGIQVGTAPGSNQQIFIRGVSTINSGGNPIIVIDGKIIDAATYKDLDPTSFTAIEVLTGDEGRELYGSRAAGGVIVLSTKKGITIQQLLGAPLPEPFVPGIPDESVPGNSIRKNFRDYAFWKPKLLTDEKGKATFTATFPDDITGWKIEALATTGKKQSGSAISTAQSYKPLLAQIVAPHFLIVGDSAQAIGKITNYTPDTLSINRTLQIAATSSPAALTIANSHIDTLALVATGFDSLNIKYVVERNKYEDGELRKLPVHKKGLKDAKGFFAALRSDTTFTIQPEAGILHLRAQTDALDVLLEEIETVKGYRYDCNEQLASKLRVLLAEKKITAFRKVKFKHDDWVKHIIKKLTENQHEAGGWGWWNKSEGLTWITLHVVQALELAEKENYQTRYDKEGVLRFLQTALSGLPLREQILSYQFLITHTIKVDPQGLYDSLIKTDLSVYSWLRLAELMQHKGFPDIKEKLLKSRKETLKGNYYWGDDNTHLFDNDAMATVIAYRILKNEKTPTEEFTRIRNFFLEQRGQSWRNTYQSALIIETLLPDLMNQAGQSTAAEVTFTDAFQFAPKKLPFDTVVNSTQPITVRKTGVSPVYFTAYREFWNSAPARTEKDFVVTTSFSENTTHLKAGKPVTLYVDVEVKKDAEYVMLNVPIPAGCSYESKNQNWRNGEVHREYEFHQTTIFCKELKAGKYQYRIMLVPRFSGRYTLNPARAEWMYFPIIYGQEGVKQVTIR
ncbi:MAG: carboxypeptidase-like regulatory domain-containing protein [Cytophagales bacterium]|nr:carboxypeptidase-like regulatory domain-containing protein [Cytophagales bacterium]